MPVRSRWSPFILWLLVLSVTVKWVLKYPVGIADLPSALLSPVFASCIWHSVACRWTFKVVRSAQYADSSVATEAGLCQGGCWPCWQGPGVACLACGWSVSRLREPACVLQQPVCICMQQLVFVIAVVWSKSWNLCLLLGGFYKKTVSYNVIWSSRFKSTIGLLVSICPVCSLCPFLSLLPSFGVNLLLWLKWSLSPPPACLPCLSLSL